MLSDCSFRYILILQSFPAGIWARETVQHPVPHYMKLFSSPWPWTLTWTEYYYISYISTQRPRNVDCAFRFFFLYHSAKSKLNQRSEMFSKCLHKAKNLIYNNESKTVTVTCIFVSLYFSSLSLSFPFSPHTLLI